MRCGGFLNISNYMEMSIMECSVPAMEKHLTGKIHICHRTAEVSSHFNLLYAPNLTV